MEQSRNGGPCMDRFELSHSNESIIRKTADASNSEQKKSKLCPECQIELTESYGKLTCEICGYIDGETAEERFDREKALREVGV
jgi:hypothetical protein